MQRQQAVEKQAIEAAVETLADRNLQRDTHDERLQMDYYDADLSAISLLYDAMVHHAAAVLIPKRRQTF